MTTPYVIRHFTVLSFALRAILGSLLAVVSWLTGLRHMLCFETRFPDSYV